MIWNRIIVAALLIFPQQLLSSTFESLQRTANHPSPAINRFTPEVPDIQLVNQRGETIALAPLLDENSNTLLAFFFTQCITICTTTTFALKSVENRVPEDTTLIMISIDPDNDSPEVLASYAREHRLPAPRWQLLTGDPGDLEALQRSLASYRANKMNHKTSIFVKAAGSRALAEVHDNFRDIPKLFKPRPKAID